MCIRDRRIGDRTGPGVTHRHEVTDLGEGEEPVVLRVVVGDPGEEVDILGRGQPLQGEVRQPPQVEPLAEHRVEVAVEHVLDEAAIRALAEGDVLGAVALVVVAGTGGHGEVEPVQRPAEVAPRDPVGQVRGRRRDIRSVPFAPGHQVDDDPCVLRLSLIHI